MRANKKSTIGQAVLKRAMKIKGVKISKFAAQIILHLVVVARKVES
jgi:hypothetical protein